MAFPFNIEELDAKISEERKPYFKGETLLRVGPKNYIVYEPYKDVAAEIYNLQLKPDDIFLLGYPRSGTSVTHEMLWLLSNNMDFANFEAIMTHTRCPYLEASILRNDLVDKWVKTMDGEPRIIAETIFSKPFDIMKITHSPRTVKSHLPLSLLPPSLLDTAKVIYMVRDPRDVAVSHYNLLKNSIMVKYQCDFKTYWKFMLKDALIFTPYFEHVKEAWAMREHPNMLFLQFNEITKNLSATARRMAKFLGKENTDDQYQRLCDALSLDKMRTFFKDNMTNKFHGLKNNSVESSFVRKGKTGGWKDYFDEEMTREAERWIADNLCGTGLSYC